MLREGEPQIALSPHLPGIGLFRSVSVFCLPFYSWRIVDIVLVSYPRPAPDLPSTRKALPPPMPLARHPFPAAEQVNDRRSPDNSRDSGGKSGTTASRIAPDFRFAPSGLPGGRSGIYEWR